MRARKLFLLALLVGLPLKAQAEPKGGRTLKFKQLITTYVQAQGFMGAVLVAKNGGVIFTQATGQANISQKKPNTTETIFRIGSLTKQFTAVAILQLQEAGLLKVTDPLSKHWPDTPKAWDSITIHHLLTHTSGIYSYTASPDYGKFASKEQTFEELLVHFKDIPLAFHPGSDYAYSNSNYRLLGLIIEKLSGRSFADYFSQRIAGPIGLKDTAITKEGAGGNRHALSYYKENDGQWARSTITDPSVSHAAGALHSTVDDMHQMSQALDEHGLLGSESLKALFTPFKDDYAYGWIVDQSGGKLRQSHGGGVDGFTTYQIRLPEDKIYIVVLSNSSAKAHRIAYHLEDIIMDRPYKLPRIAISLDPAEFDRFTGKYQFNDAVLIIGRDENFFYAELTGQSAFQIFPESKTHFFYRAFDAQIVFNLDDDGQPTQLTFYQLGKTIIAPRL